MKLGDSKIILYFFLFLSYLTCSNPPEPTQTEELSHFFPMQVGNRWVYTTDYTFTQFEQYMEIIGTESIGTNEYFAWERRFSSGTYVERRSYRAGPGKTIYINYFGREFLYIDFQRPPGEQWNSYAGFVGVVQRKNFECSTPGRSFRKCIEIFFDDPGVDSERWETYAPGIGLVLLRTVDGISELKSARVNGISYP